MVTLDLSDRLEIDPPATGSRSWCRDGGGRAGADDDDLVCGRSPWSAVAPASAPQAHPGRGRPGRRQRRRRRRAALGRHDRPATRPCALGADVAFCLVGGGPGSGGSARCSSRCDPWPGRSPCSPRRCTARRRWSTGAGTSWAARPAITATTWSRRRWSAYPELARTGATRFGGRDGAAAAPGRERLDVVRRGRVPGRRAAWCTTTPDGPWRERRRSEEQCRGRPTGGDYLPRGLRWWRVRLSSFLCFFFRMRLRRFLISEPMAERTQ